MLAAVLAIACFISANPSPTQWEISGPTADVQAIDRLVRQTPGARIAAHASSRGVDFARFELSGLTYGKFMTLINAAQERKLWVSPLQLKTPTCPDGRAEDLDDAYANPVTVGVLGAADKLEGVKAQLPWAHFSPFRLNDGRTGIAFQPAESEIEPYQAFVSKAASGRFADVQVVLLRGGVAGGFHHAP